MKNDWRVSMDAAASSHEGTALRLAPADDDESYLLQYLNQEGELVSGRQAPMPLADARHLYEAMSKIRIIDERMVTLQRQGRIGFYIGSSGEEASIIGPVAAMKDSDWLFPCYRENGAYLMRGMPLQRWVDNLFGNANDAVLGRQMPNHIVWAERNITSVSSPIGTQIPQAAGAAMAARQLGRDDIALTFFGEGATSSNDFHTGMNFAGVWKAPVVFVCRNNGWAISMPRDKQCAADFIADKAAGYGMPGVRVDGNDLFACYAATSDAIARARRGEGPTMLECVTYRVTGHSTSDDPKVYRKDEEVEPWRMKDPLVRLRRYLEARGAWSPGEEAAYRANIEATLREAIQAAEATSPPALETLFSDVYQDLPWHLKEQLEEARNNLSGADTPKGEFPL